MSDLSKRLKNWRSVHLARLHLLMEEAADEMELLESRMPPLDHLRNGALDGCETVALSENADCPDPDNEENEETVGSILARRITGLKSTLEAHWVAAERADSEYRVEIAILRSDNSRRADLEVGLREGVQKLHADVRRLEGVITALADQDATLRGLLERCSLQSEKPAIGEKAMLTDAERL